MNFISLPPGWWHRRRLHRGVGAGAAKATSPRLKIEIRSIGGRDEVDVLGVALHPLVDEGAEREHREALLAGLVEGEAGEPAAEAAAFEAFLDLGVDQRQQPFLRAVDEEAGELAVDRDLEAFALRRVADD